MLGVRHRSYDQRVLRPCGELFRSDNVQLRGVADSGDVAATAQFHHLEGRRRMLDKGLTRFIRRRRICLTLAVSVWLLVLAVPSANVAAGRGGGLVQQAGVAESPIVP
jgi:hypothetical protein